MLEEQKTLCKLFERKVITAVSHRLRRTLCYLLHFHYGLTPVQIFLSQKKIFLATLIQCFLRSAHSLLPSKSVTYRKQTAYTNK